MKSLTLIAVTATTMLVMSANSRAEDVCNALKEIKSASKGGFRAWKGAEVPQRRPREGRKVFESSYSLPGASSCEITDQWRERSDGVRMSSTSFSCDWEVENPREANEQYASLRDDVKRCFPNAKGEESSNSNGLTFEVEDFPDQDNLSMSVDSYTSDYPSVSISAGVSTSR